MRNQGFTLIELLVVIFIIGILTGVILPNFVSSRQRARDARRKHDLVEIKNALRLYYNDNQTYPVTVGFGGEWLPYMRVIPEESLDEWESYGYCVNAADHDSFLLWACLENAGDQEAAESAWKCGVTGGGTPPCTSGCTGGTLCYYACGD